MKTLKRRSQNQEKSVAKNMNARTVVASGAKWNAKGDVRNDKFLIECKTTSKDFYKVTTKVWEKISKEAVKDGLRIPLLIVDLKDSDRYVIFNPNDFDFTFSTLHFANTPTAKSYSLREWDNADELPLGFTLESVQNPCKNHVLLALTFNNFIHYFKNEL